MVKSKEKEIVEEIGILDPIEHTLNQLEKEYPTIFKGFSQIEREQFALFAKKHLDYGLNGIAAGTQLETAEEIKFALMGIWYRMSDKMSRWKNVMLSTTNMEVQNHDETILDTFQDLANYAMIAQLVSRNLWKK